MPTIKQKQPKAKASASATIEPALAALELVNLSVGKCVAELHGEYSPNFHLPTKRRVQLRGPLVSKLVSADADDDGPALHQFRVECGMRLIDEDVSDKPTIDAKDVEELLVASVSVTFLACYVLKEGMPPLGEAPLRAFGERNVPFNIWPYWREILQSASLRLGVGPITLPLRRLNPSPATATATATGKP